MKPETALVTGASGFLGSRLVRALVQGGVQVRAGVRRLVDGSEFEGVPQVTMDVRDRGSLDAVMAGIDTVYHLAALIDSKESAERLFETNAGGTRNVSEAAAKAGVEKLLYCSTTAVYGLVGGRNGPVSEEMPARAFEPYGRSKLMGEAEALRVSRERGLPTVIIRPAAIFGPGDRTAIGAQLRRAAVSRIILPGSFADDGFNFVHVQDVAAAAIHLMHCDGAAGQIYNIAVNPPVTFSDGFSAYRMILSRRHRPLVRARLVAVLSAVCHRFPRMTSWLMRWGGRRLTFSVWRPGFTLTSSSGKLLRTSFRFRFNRFEEVLESSLFGDR